MDDDKKHDTVTDADREVIRQAAAGEGIPIRSVAGFKALAQAAADTKTHFEKTAPPMTRERATFVRRLRCIEGYTWRAVAQRCFDEWSGDWTPSSNQLMGMTLCENAAAFFGEDYMQDPWN